MGLCPWKQADSHADKPIVIRVLERLAKWAGRVARKSRLVDTASAKPDTMENRMDDEGWVAGRLEQLEPPDGWHPDSGNAWRRLTKRTALGTDCRSKKLIFVAHCMLNQNARDAGAAEFPAMMKPLLDVVATQNISVIQLPCPELMLLGLGRGRDDSATQTIRERLESAESQVRLGSLIDQVVYQIKEYQAQGIRIIGILGKNGSPTCGVRMAGHFALAIEAEGVFIRLLRLRLNAEGFDIRIKGIDDHCQLQATEWILKRANDEAKPE